MFPLRLIWRLAKVALVIVLIVVAIPLAGIAYGFATTPAIRKSSLPGLTTGAPLPELAAEVRAEIPGYQRTEESTYLTYPEWAIVYAAREYAAFLDAGRRESEFPYWAYIGRFWQDYAMVIRASSGHPFNFANHQMLAVIGTSHTIELAVQSAYENTVGRFTEWTSGRPVAADRYLARVAKDYAAFLDQVPWYQFAYAQKRDGLLLLLPEEGDDPTRTTERKSAFGLAYTIKQAYADLIKSGLSATAEPAALDIHVWAKGPVALAIDGEPDTRLEKDMGLDGAVFVTKRYQAFTEMLPRLIGRGLRFVEIGGNDEILFTAISNGAIVLPPKTRLLFDYRLPADPRHRRLGLAVAVRRLHEVIPLLEKSGARLEHVYDY
ncbi:MAG: hypothetical protein M9924_12185 [Rhizobiaceae bacterium]|nr:hypothetical protein [Rhizobiaceae bacterium]